VGKKGVFGKDAIASGSDSQGNDMRDKKEKKNTLKTMNGPFHPTVSDGRK